MSLGVSDLKSTATILAPDDRPPDAGPDRLQLRDAVVPQRLQPAQRRRRQRHEPALHHHRHAAGPQQRGRSLVGARQRRRPGQAGQLPAHQPVSEHRVAGPAQGVRGRQRALRRRQEGHRQHARHPARQDRDDEAPAMSGRRQTSDDERVPRKDRTGASPFVVGLVVLVVACIGVFFGFTKHVPFTHGFRVQAVFQSANSIRKNSPVRIAGVNVGKVTKIEGKPGSDAAVVTMEIDGQGPADPQGRRDEDPPADLPGGQLLRRHLARHAVGADDRRRRHDPAHPDRDPGPARPGAQRAAERHADEPAEDPRRARDGPDLQAVQGAGHRRRPQRARRERGTVAQRRHPLRRAFAEGHGDRGRRLPGDRGPRPLRAHRRAEPHDGGARAQRGPAQEPRHGLQHDGGGHGVAGDQPARLDPPARADAAERQPGAGLAQRRLPATRAPSRARSCPASARRPPPSTRPSRGSPRRASCWARPSSRASRAS